MKRTTCALATLALGSAVAVGDGAWARQGERQTPQGADPTAGRNNAAAGMPDAVLTTGSVLNVDRDKRTLVFKDPAGDQIKVQVPPDLTGFDQLKRGDRIDIAYYDSVAVAFPRQGAAHPVAEVRARVEPAHPGGIVGREVTVAAEVINVDTKDRSVELKLPSGQMQNVVVTDPALQGQLKDLRPGQTATVTYTEAMTASIQPLPVEPRGVGD
jgi:hypothetical protein